MTTNNLALTATIGASVLPSLAKTFKTAITSTDKLGEKYREANKHLAATNVIAKRRQQLEALQKKQAAAGDSAWKFSKQIQNAQDALTRAEEKARGYGLSLGDIVKEQDRLTRATQRFNKALESREKWAGRRQSLGGTAASLGASAGVAGGLLATGFTAVTLANQTTARNDAQARAVGVDPANMQALGGVVRGLGFDAENVVDLFEELNNKMGESAGLKEMTAVTEALQILGLEYDHLAALNPEKQFLAIARAAQQLGDATKASAAADILMGGEANKIIGDLVRRGESIDALIAKQKQLMVLTKEGRTGAALFNTALGNLQTAGGSALQELAGIIGNELSPIINAWATDLVTFFRENRTEIVAFIQGTGDFFRELPTHLSKAAEQFGSIVSALTKVASWINDDEEDEKPSRVPRPTMYNTYRPYSTRPSYSNNAYAAQSAINSAKRAKNIVNTAQAGNQPSTTTAVVNLTVNNAQNLDEQKLAAAVEGSVQNALSQQQRRIGIQNRSSIIDG